MQEELFDNKYFMDFQAALDLIKDYFKKNLPEFELIWEHKDNSGHWGLRYSFSETVVFISCDRGYLEHSITIDGRDFPLWQFERMMTNVEAASEKNIRFTLDVIKRFFR